MPVSAVRVISPGRVSVRGRRLGIVRPLRVGELECPHWGYVIQGKVTFTFADGHQETFETGDAYYAPPGHTPHLFAGSEVVEFSPSDAMAGTVAVIEKNLEALTAS